MSDDRPRSLLAATDLSPACDEVLRAAGELATHTGAELHVLHVLAPAGLLEGEAAAEVRRGEAREELQRQIARSFPAGAEAVSRSLRTGPVHRALEAAAEELGSDLVVLGPHGGTAAGAHFLGSTADRVLRTSRIPCLVVRGALTLPLRRIGVPVDLSEPSFGALRLAMRWAPGLTGPGDGDDAPVHLLHVGWPVTQVDVPDYEEATLRPRLAEEIAAAAAAAGGDVTAEVEIDWDYLAGQRICLWAHQREIGLLVVGTHGRSGLPRALLGSVATRLAREAPCSVLLVPPDATAEGGEVTVPALDRVLVGTDFSRGSTEAAAWIAEHLAPEAELVLAHVADVPYPPRILRAGLPPREELVATLHEGAERRLEELARTLPGRPARWLAREGRAGDVLAELARETAADLVAVGGHGEGTGLWANLGSTAESLLAASPVPVLVARVFAAEAPRHLLVPLDGSVEARQALAWAIFLADRVGASLTVLHVVSSGFVAAIRRVSSEPAARELRERLLAGVRTWLDEALAATGLPAERVAGVVEEGIPALQILASAARLGSDLVVMGSRGSGGAGNLGLGTVASTVARHGAVPVLVVPPSRP